MATTMTDPHIALVSFQEAFALGHISPRPGELHADLLVLLDRPQGEMRLTYALMRKNRPVAIAMCVANGVIDGHPCFNLGYAVDAAYRSAGFGSEVTRKGLNELSHGFRRAGLKHLHVEAIVSPQNVPSTKIASKLISSHPSPCKDELSGQDALHYLRQLF